MASVRQALRLLRTAGKIIGGRRGFFIGPGVLLSAQPLLDHSKIKVAQKSPDESGNQQNLTRKKLVENASSLATESVCSLYHHAALAVMEAEQEYAKAVEDLVSCIEYMMISPDVLSQDDLWMKIIEARHLVNETKETKLEMDNVLDSAEKLVALAAEVSFASGAEYSAISANERLLSVQSRLASLRRVTKDAETKLTKAEVRVIEVASKQSVEAQE